MAQVSVEKLSTRVKKEVNMRNMKLVSPLLAAAIALAACGGSTSTGASNSSVPQASSTTVVAPSAPSSSSAPPVSVTPTSTAATVTSSSNCAVNDLPPADSPFAAVIVHDIPANDPDQGLNIRLGPSTSNLVQFALPNGSTMASTGLCEMDSVGQVWWEVEDGSWNGWAAARYLKEFDASTTTACPVANFNPIGKGTVEKILGDFDGNGSIDTVFLSYDGLVNAPAAWTGTTSTVQIQYADGGLSYELDVTSILNDGGPAVGIPQMPTFPHRIDPANSSRSVAVMSSHYDTSATGAGQAHFIGELNCSPTVVANVPVDPSVGNPQRPILCDIGGGGRTQLWVLDGLTTNFDYLVTRYDFQGGSYLLQGQTTSGNANVDPEPTVC